MMKLPLCVACKGQGEMIRIGAGYWEPAPRYGKTFTTINTLPVETETCLVCGGDGFGPDAQDDPIPPVGI